MIMKYADAVNRYKSVTLLLTSEGELRSCENTPRGLQRAKVI
jgi:hypothetical protein